MCRYQADIHNQQNKQKKEKRKERRHKNVRTWNTNQRIHRSLLIPLDRHHKASRNPSTSEFMLTNIQSLKPKINMILHYILQHKLDICFITETWISKNEDLQYIKANLMTQGFNMLLSERKKQKKEEV